MKFIKVFGERNSGTNYLESLVRRNFTLSILPGKVNPAFRRLKEFEIIRYLYFTTTFNTFFGWKHAQINPKLINGIAKSNETLFLVITKNPYSFLLSLYKRPYHQRSRKADFASFIQSRWNATYFENGPKFYESPIELWNAKQASYLEFMSSNFNVYMIRYEDLLLDPEDIFNKVRTKFNLSKSDKFFTNASMSMKGEADKDFSYYKEYYLHERWREKLTHEHISTINSRLNPDIVTRLGYTLLND
jgi:hypothetical protein